MYAFKRVELTVTELFYSMDRGEGESPWTQTFVAMSASTNPATVALIDTVLRDMGTADFPLTLQVRQLIVCDII